MATAEVKRFDRRLPLWAASATLILFWVTQFLDEDLSLALSALAIVLFSFYLIVFALLSKKRRLSLFAMLAAMWIVSAISLFHYGAHRDFMRWIVLSHHYKAKVLAQRSLPKGELAHVEWDGWGMFSMDTTVYAVYDPSDTLSADVNHPGRFRGIPCEVYNVRRLEKYWYSVQFYTDQEWDRCQ